MAISCKSSCSSAKSNYVGSNGNYAPVNRLQGSLDKAVSGDYNVKRAAVSAKDGGLAQRLYSSKPEAFYDGRANVAELADRVTSAPTKGMATSYVGDIGAVVYGRN